MDSSIVGSAAPESLRGVFTRAFRWGTVDVLNPAHCDFAALRVAVLSTHMKVRSLIYQHDGSDQSIEWATQATSGRGRELWPKPTRAMWRDEVVALIDVWKSRGRLQMLPLLDCSRTSPTLPSYVVYGQNTNA